MNFRQLLFLFSVVMVPAFTRAADVSFYGVIKAQQFRQTNQAAPVALATNGFSFNAFVVASSNHVVTNATVEPPGTNTFKTLGSDATEAFWLYTETFHTQAALDAAFPGPGSIFAPSVYQMTNRTVNDGLKATSVSYFLATTPSTPQITTFAAAQSIDSSAPFTLRWQSFTAGTLADIVQLTVFDSASNLLFSTPAPFQPGALTGQSNSVIVPAGSLPSGAALTAHLTIARPGLPNTNDYAGAIGLAALTKDTEFPMATLSVPPRLRMTSAGAAPFQFLYQGDAHRAFTIQVTTNFQLWLDLLTVTNSASGLGTFTDPNIPTLDRRFYRIRVEP